MVMKGKLNELLALTGYQQLGSLTDEQLDSILSKVDKNFRSPLKLSATHPTPDSKLRISSNQVEMGDGTKLVLPPIEGNQDVFPDSWIDFLAGTTSGGNIYLLGAAFALPTGSTAGRFRRAVLSYNSFNNYVNCIFSTEQAVFANLSTVEELHDTLGDIYIGHIDLVAVSSNTYKTVGSDTSIIENKVSTETRIFNAGSAGSGGGGAIAKKFQLSDNQVVESNVTGFIVNISKNKAFTADIAIKRSHNLSLDSSLSKIEFSNSFYKNLGTGFNAHARSIATQSNGKILLGGAFTSFNGNTRNRLVRLNADGTEDTAFYANLGTGFNSDIYFLAVQSDDKILIGGTFTTLNDIARNRFIRLNSDGTVDTTFYTNLGSAFGGGVIFNIAIQSDNKILIGGSFTSYNGNTRNYLVRLNSTGTEDTAFYTNLGTGFTGGSINAIAIQSDGKIVVGGSISTLNINTRYSLVRLNSNGTEDTAFYTNLGTGFNSAVSTISIQSDGKIVVGGQFTTLNSTTRNCLVRLNTDGTVDTTFYANLGTAFNASNLTKIQIQSNGKILISGSFNSFNDKPRNKFIRLNSDGTEDVSFYYEIGHGVSQNISTFFYNDKLLIITSSAVSSLFKEKRCLFTIMNVDGSLASSSDFLFNYNGTIYCITRQTNGKLLIAGTFTSLNGVTRNRLVRLNTDGTIDTTFITNIGTGFNGEVYSAVVQSDGKIVVGGNFTSFNGNTRNRLVRLNADGTEDTAFYTSLGTGFVGLVYCLAVQADGKIVVGGDFTSLNGTTRLRFVRLNSDGTVDTAFYTNIGTGVTGGIVNSIAIQSDNKIVIGGQFTGVNGTTRNRLVRFNSDGTVDTTFYTNLGSAFSATVYSVAIQSDGKIIVGGDFSFFNGNTRNRLVRLNSTGTEDTAFYTNLGTGFNGTVQVVGVQADGKIVVGGLYFTFNGNTRNRIIRVNTDGLEDTTFYTNTVRGLNNTVYSLAFQIDGTILVGGSFYGSHGVGYDYLLPLSKPYEANKVYTLKGFYKTKDAEWNLGSSSYIGDDPGVTLTMDSNGQLKYTTTSIGGDAVESTLSYTLQGL